MTGQHYSGVSCLSIISSPDTAYAECPFPILHRAAFVSRKSVLLVMKLLSYLEFKGIPL